jgi:acyl-CoA synthetase (AMP-forming)/AMP-acid ligase II
MVQVGGTEESDVSKWNFADVWETVAEALPDAPALVHRGRTRTWREFDQRADNVGQWLLDAEVKEQDKLALYLYNCPDYLEASYAAYKIGMVPINTNYRYADDELVYLWENADTVAVVFHGAFVERIEGIRDRVPAVRSWLWVDDQTTECPAWAVPYEEVAGTTGPTAADHRGVAPTTSTCCTPVARQACPKASCGARTTCSPASTAAVSAGTQPRAVSTTSGPNWWPTAPA